MGPAGMRGEGSEDSRISGYLIKQRLVRAALAGIAAIRAADPEARFLHVEPVLHVAPCEDDAEQQDLARRITAFQWQTFDMLSGRAEPGLGGHPDALGWLGLNHYHSSQWEVPSEKRLAWHLRDPRRRPLSALLGEAWRRYQRPMIMAETGHVGIGRAAWLHEIAGEARRARAQGVPLQGVCLYPLLDRPDWRETQRWHRSGLWHLDRPELRRLHRPYAKALLSWARPEPPAAAAASSHGRPGMLVLLPCPWEDWRAPREPLLRALAGRPLRLLEPPRAAAMDTVLRSHTLAPAADLLILHGRDGRGWAAAPTAEQLALLRQALREAGRERWLCWLAGWRGDCHPAWWRELAGAGLILQPDPLDPPRGELLRRAQGRLPAAWPLPAARRPLPQSYEAEEVALLLAGIPAPRVWLVAPSSPVEAERLRSFAAARPSQQWLVDAAPPASALPWPANMHWLGRVHDSLHAALAASVEKVLPWSALDAAGSGDSDAPAVGQPGDVVDGSLQALFEPDPGLPAEQRTGT